MEPFFIPMVFVVVIGMLAMPVSAITVNPPSPSNIQEWVQSQLNYWFRGEISHSEILGKGADDHTQYLNLNGRSGGQQAAGGNAANEDLILNGTSHATKTTSYILLQPTGGRVGINTSEPEQQLHINSQGVQLFLATDNDHWPNGFFIKKNIALEGVSGYNGPDYVSLIQFGNAPMIFGTNNLERVRITGDGNVSIRTTISTANITAAGSIRLTSFGAGTLNTDANGNLYVISDDKYKTAETPYTKGLTAIMSTNPITYRFNAASGLDQQNTYLGFSAQQLRTAIPEAVYEKQDIEYKIINTTKLDEFGINETEQIEIPHLDKDGKQTTTLSISDRAIIATLVNAVKEQQKEIDMLKGVCGK